MAIVIDLIVVAIIAVIALVSAKHGFIKVFVQAIGYILAGMLAFFNKCTVSRYHL